MKKKAFIWAGAGLVVLVVAVAIWAGSQVWMDGSPISKKAESCVLSSENITSLGPLKVCSGLKSIDARGCSLTAEEVCAFIAETGCEVRWDIPIGGEKFDSESREIVCTPEAGEAGNLLLFPHLERAMLVECREYEELEALLGQETTFAISYSVGIGNVVVDENEENAIIEGASFEALMGAMACLPNLQGADLRGCELSVEEIRSLGEAYPEKSFLCHVETEAVEGDTDAETLVLRAVTEDTGAILGLFPELKTVDLRGCSGIEAVLPELWATFPAVEFLYQLELGNKVLTGEETSLTVTSEMEFGAVEEALPLLVKLETLDLRQAGYTEEQCKALAEVCPEAVVLFTLSYCGEQVDTGAEELDFSGVALTAEQVEAGLPYLRGLKKLVLCDCGIENEQMGALRERYPEIQFIWTVKMGPHELRTDAVSFSTFNRSKHISPADSKELAETKRRTYRLTTEDISVLEYCTELEGLDLGHNDIEDISVLKHCKKLRYLILADNYITDISVLQELPELMYVELFMNGITDLSPLSGLTKLLDLNVCNNKIEDFSPIFGLSQLERFWYWRNPGSEGSRKTIAAALPACKCVYDCRGDDTGMGWREHDRYFAMRRLFRTGEE